MERNVWIAGAIGVVFGAGLMWGVSEAQDQVTVVEGVAYANADGDAIGLRSDGENAEEGYSLLPMNAETVDTSLPSCIEPPKNTPVRLGLISIEPQGDIPGGQQIVWFECTGPSREP